MALIIQYVQNWKRIQNSESNSSPGHNQKGDVLIKHVENSKHENIQKGLRFTQPGSRIAAHTGCCEGRTCGRTGIGTP